MPMRRKTSAYGFRLFAIFFQPRAERRRRNEMQKSYRAASELIVLLAQIELAQSYFRLPVIDSVREPNTYKWFGLIIGSYYEHDDFYVRALNKEASLSVSLIRTSGLVRSESRPRCPSETDQVSHQVRVKSLHVSIWRAQVHFVMIWECFWHK